MLNEMKEEEITFYLIYFEGSLKKKRKRRGVRKGRIEGAKKNILCQSCNKVLKKKLEKQKGGDDKNFCLLG